MSWIERLSFAVLLVLVIVGTVKWLPLLPSEALRNLTHGLVGLYIVLRGVSHALSRQYLLVTHPLVAIPVVLLVLFVPSFNASMQLGWYANIFVATVFWILLVAHFLMVNDREKRLLTVAVVYVAMMLCITLYTFVTSLTPIQGFETSVRLWPAATPPGSLAFFEGPGRYVSHVGTAAVLAGTLAIGDRRQTNRRIWATVTIVLVTAIVYAVFVAFRGHGRTGLVYLAVFLGCLLLYRRPKFAIANAIVGIVSATVALRFRPSLLVTLADITSGRLLLYAESVRIIAENPLGVGIGNFDTHYVTPGWYPGSFFQSVPTGPHNLIFQHTVQSGLLVGVLVVYWTVLILRESIQSYRSSARPILFASSTTVLISLLVASTVGGYGPFKLYSSMIWWTLLGGYVAVKYGGLRSGLVSDGKETKPIS